MEALLRQQDLMEIMNVSRATLWRILKYKNFPKPVVLMGCKRWRQEEFTSWLETRKSE